MKTRSFKISIILGMIGFVMLFGNFASFCEQNSMTQTLETRLCEMFNVVLLFIANVLSYMMILAGLLLFVYDLIATAQKKTKSEQEYVASFKNLSLKIQLKQFQRQIPLVLRIIKWKKQTRDQSILTVQYMKLTNQSMKLTKL